MVKLSSKTLSLVISAIKNMRESKGSTSRDILNYVSSVYDIPQDVAKRQMVAALKRGVAHGILRKSDGCYSLPTDTEAECTEVAAQELGLLDLCCRRKKREQRRKKSCKKGGKSSRKRSRKSRRSKSGRCKRIGGRSRSGKRRRGKSRKGGCGCKSKSRRGRGKRSKRSGKARCKSVKRRAKKIKNESVDGTKCKTDFIIPESFGNNNEIGFANRGAMRCRDQSRSRSRNRNAVPIA